MSLPASVCVWQQVQCSRPLTPRTTSRGQAHKRHNINDVNNRTWVAASTAAAAAAGADSSGPVSTTAWPRAESAEASALDQGPTHEEQQHTTVENSRRRRKTTSSSTNTEAETASDKDRPQTAQQQQQQRKRKQIAKQKAPPVDADLVDTLISRTQLSQRAAQKIVATKAGGYGIPKETGKLCINVHHLQQMLGPEYADLALTRFPSLVAYRWEAHKLLSATHTTSSK